MMDFFLLFVLNLVIKPDVITLDQPTRVEIGSIESQFNSDQYQLNEMYIPKNLFSNAELFELDQPLMYIRQEVNFPVDSEVYYYFSRDDTVRFITHQWDMRAKKYKPVIDLSTPGIQNIDVWNEKFNQLSDEITSKLGPPLESMGFKTKYSNSRLIHKERNIKWVTYECITTINMIWYQNIIKQKGETKIIPSFRIVTKTFWNQEKSSVICIENQN